MLAAALVKMIALFTWRWRSWMPDYRRYRVPGGTYFFTVNLLERYPNDLLVAHIDSLRTVVRDVRKKRPFVIDAWIAAR
jgi:putative transposase